jgi:hypothetical protein
MLVAGYYASSDGLRLLADQSVIRGMILQMLAPSNKTVKGKLEKFN